MYAIYLRKSRADLDAEQRGVGETLARHRAQLLELARTRGLAIGREYTEIVSGDTISERPQMIQLLSDVSARRWEGVLVMDIERLGRGDSIDQGIISQAFRLSGTLIVTPARTYDIARDPSDALFSEMQQFVSRMELANIKRRMWAGRCASAREGRWQSPRAPFGYRRVLLQDGKTWTLEIIPDQADAVRLCFDYYAHGRDGQRVGMPALANIMHAMGMPTLTGATWTSSTILNILKNPVYAGWVRWGYRRTIKAFSPDGSVVAKRPRADDMILSRGLHPPIVTQELFDEVQAKLALNKAPASASGPLLNPLAGLVLCSECGHHMWRQYDAAHPRYPNGLLTCRTPRCRTVGIDLQVVESAIISTLRQWMAMCERPDDPDVRTPAKDPVEIQREAIQRHIDSLNQQRSRVMTLLEQGVYTVDDFRVRSALYAEQLSAARAELDALPPPATDTRAAILALAPRISHVLDAYSASQTAAEKNQLLASVIDHVDYKKTQHASRWGNAADFLTLTVWPVVL